MGEYLEKVPENIREHIRKITATSGMPNNDESIELVAQAWIEKRDAFESRLSEFEMEEWDEFAREEDRGAIVLTYSGSLVTIGPLVEGVRTAEYASIGLRHDVPDSASEAASILAEDIRADEPVRFSKGPVQKSSAVFKIAVLSEQLAPEEEQERLTDATQVLSEDFVEVNKTIVAD
ncbi:MAG TPA: hypothetical protein VMW87_15525 [Spirochaetia bacterium]|nr:hypothetical protein [Spirochaetia bacterium]